jgi:branched-chain amino acid aminotransferase
VATIWYDGNFLDQSELRVSPFDRGLCHGLSLFETILAVRGRPVLLGQHLDRLRLGLERLAVSSVGMDERGLQAVIVSLLEKNGLTRGMARVRLSVSLGEGRLDHTDSGKAWAWITALPIGESPASLRLTEAPWRFNKESVLRGIKVGSYAEHLIALDMARREGFDEMLFFNSAGELCESAMANVFLIRKGALLTPGLDSGCLAGVTRQLVLRMARERKIDCREMPLKLGHVKKADGIFLTSSVRGPVWVSFFGGKEYETHPLFNAIQQMWLEEMSALANGA